MSEMCSDPSKYGSMETVPCRLCKRPTTMLATELCDRCYIVESVVLRNKTLTIVILLRALGRKIKSLFGKRG